MVESTKNEDFLKIDPESLINPNLCTTTFPLHMLTMHLSFCMHLDIYLICVYSQSYPNLMTGIRVMLQKPTRFSEKFCSPTAAR